MEWSGPIEMAVEEVEGAFAIDAMSPGKNFERRSIAEAKLVVEPLHFGELTGDFGTEGHRVVLPPFDHERAGYHEKRQLGMAESPAHIEMREFPLTGEHVAHGLGAGDHAGPLVEVCAADGQGVSFDGWGDEHGGRPAVADSVKTDAASIHLRSGRQPREPLFVLGGDQRVKGSADGVGLAVELTEPFAMAIQIVRRKGDESAVGKPGRKVAGSDPLSRLNGFCRDVLEPVLADDDRSTFAWLQIPRYQ